MWVNQIILAVIGISGGLIVAGGLFSFIIELGIAADFADRTHTADKILLYEDCVALGGIVGNLISIFQIHISSCERYFCRMLGYGSGRNTKFVPDFCTEAEDGPVYLSVYIKYCSRKGRGGSYLFL